MSGEGGPSGAVGDKTGKKMTGRGCLREGVIVVVWYGLGLGQGTQKIVNVGKWDRGQCRN